VEAREQVDQVEGVLLVLDPLLQDGDGLVEPISAEVQTRQHGDGTHPLFRLCHLQRLAIGRLRLGVAFAIASEKPPERGERERRGLDLGELAVQRIRGLAIALAAIVDLRVHLERLLVRLLSLHRAPQRLQHPALEQVGRDAAGVGGDHLLRLGERLVEIARVDGDLAELQLGFEVAGIEAGRLPQLPKAFARLLAPEVGPR
jgi:hypothetical protein